MDREKVLTWLEICGKNNDYSGCCPYSENGFGEYGQCRESLMADAYALLKEQDERLRKLQKDKDKLCLEVSEWKHKFHDAPPKFISQGIVDQIRWERDTALSQLEQIGKGLGSKMDDIVALLKEQEPKQVNDIAQQISCFSGICPSCGKMLNTTCNKNFCGECGQAVKWDA